MVTRPAPALVARSGQRWSRGWLAAAVGWTVLAGLWHLDHVGLRIDLPGPHSVPVHLLGTLLLLAAAAASVLAARHERVGLVLLALVMVAAGCTWPALPEHAWAGPVVADLSRSHGIHAGDPLMLVPIGLAVALLALAERRSRAGRGHRRLAIDRRDR